MLLLLCIMLDSDPDRRGRTSVCRRITPVSADQCEIREVDVCVCETACLPTGRKRRHSFTQSPYSGLALR